MDRTSWSAVNIGVVLAQVVGAVSATRLWSFQPEHIRHVLSRRGPVCPDPCRTTLNQASLPERSSSSVSDKDSLIPDPGF
jgi:hypothetical protein